MVKKGKAVKVKISKKKTKYKCPMSLLMQNLEVLEMRVWAVSMKKIAPS